MFRHQKRNLLLLDIIFVCVCITDLNSEIFTFVACDAIVQVS